MERHMRIGSRKGLLRTKLPLTAVCLAQADENQGYMRKVWDGAICALSGLPPLAPARRARSTHGKREMGECALEDCVHVLCARDLPGVHSTQGGVQYERHRRWIDPQGSVWGSGNEH
ncbi:hypothetical protein B0H13DRAFT_2171476 [Mycena leptocephala]|nr:hypothetical protein B0H13DRAFT_2171476 [Mycena leptocephala]